MKQFASVDELKDWERFFEFSKLTLKALDGEAPCFVSKDKLAFDIAGKPWNGHAFLAGKFGVLSAKELKKAGVLFKEGVCRSEGKDLYVSGIPAKLSKEALRTVLKLRLGYRLVVPDEEDQPDVAERPGGASVADSREQKLDQLRRLGSDLDRLLATLSKQSKAS